MESQIGIIILVTALILFIVFVVSALVWRNYSLKQDEARKSLLNAILDSLGLDESTIEYTFSAYNKEIIVRSRQTLEKYDCPTFFKSNRDYFDKILDFIELKKDIVSKLKIFLDNNEFINEKEYPYVEEYISQFINKRPYYTIKVKYITSAGKCLSSKNLILNEKDVKEIQNTPELYMSKTEIKEIEKERLNDRKKKTYSDVNDIIDKANRLKKSLLIKKDDKTLDDLILKLFDKTINNIQKIKQLDSGEWLLIDDIISDVRKEITSIQEKNNRLDDYYKSSEFSQLKKTCEMLMNSQKEFNNYIEEKINSISKLFGTRIIRSETEHNDVYNYVRTYNKTISPYTVELSSNVFSSAENNPMQYLIKCFYPDRSMYKEQIIHLKNLLNELDALKDAKEIINNYKKDYLKYMDNVPSYVLKEDENGFYSRLGFAIIDENVLNVEYKFSYTSDGGMAHRSFTVPMTEETIGELINTLQRKLSTAVLAKEQRALMTQKLRQDIKERDNFTCCLCGNSIYKEPNLLLEIDHKIPISKGGLTIEDNLQTLCWKCNRSKGAKL